MQTAGLIPPAAIPAAKVSMCSSEIPTSKNLSGYFSANPFSLVPSVIAAVQTAMRGSWEAASVSASDIISLQEGRDVAVWFCAASRSVLGPIPWKKGELFSASQHPLPFFVRTWIRTGSLQCLASRKTSSISSMSWPLNGPQ